MAQAAWSATGEYFESCSCDFLCPCLPSALTAPPTKGSCTAVLIFHVDRGRYGSTTLDGLNFAVALRTPGPMIEGNWEVGIITDERGTAEQREALAAIASGQGGGPMANLGPLVGKVLGVEAHPIRFEHDGMRWSASIPGMLEDAIEGVPGANPDEPMYIENAGHPANTRLALAKSSRSHLNAFGLRWDDESGQNNGHFAPFAWNAA
jgi:hypothetical protein